MFTQQAVSWAVPPPPTPILLSCAACAHRSPLAHSAAIMARLVAQLIVNRKGLEGIKYLNRTHAANGNL